MSQLSLPTIKIEPFSGDYNKLLSFIDTFNSLVHNNPNLDFINKFLHLKNCLTGNAAKTIQHLEIISDNYMIAYTLLAQRFKNEKLIVQRHIDSILDILQIHKTNGMNLRQLLDNIKIHTKALNSLGENTNNWSTLLLFIITRKLDF